MKKEAEEAAKPPAALQPALVDVKVQVRDIPQDELGVEPPLWGSHAVLGRTMSAVARWPRTGSP
jgi:hypothetical protein